MPDLEEVLRARLAPAFEAASGAATDPLVRRSDRADFQADAALAIGRRLSRDPREIAASVLKHDPLDDLCSAVEISGPRFINLTVADEVLSSMLAEIAGDERLSVPRVRHPQRITVDYSAPNAAKEMHVGHLRSTIIGDAAVRLLEWLGHDVVRQNHIGEWGTPFGMLIEHLLDIGAGEATRELSAGDLTTFYQEARIKFDTGDAFKDRARGRVVLLQGGDEPTRELWQALVEDSKAYFLAVYRLLGVRLTEHDFFGESYYNDQLPALVDTLDELGQLRTSDGALCVFPAGFTNRAGEEMPIIVRKRDGGFGYGATDLATMRHRIDTLGATRLLYVVGLPQRQHLEMVFQTAREAGWLTSPVRAEHVGHGSVLGIDGKVLRTRAGATVKLVDLLEEAVSKADQVVAAKNPELTGEERATVARMVGIGAVKYADLSANRTGDYVFDLDRMLAFEGNTAAYLQFAHARIRSIFRRAGIAAPQVIGGLAIREPSEHVLAIELISFGSRLLEVADSLQFDRLARYLYELATSFTAFYEKCPVIRAEGDVRASRLFLCDLTARTLSLGLGLMGIETPEQM